MKILIVSPRFPFKQGKADSMTVYHMIDFLSRRGHQVLLATFDNGERFSVAEREALKAKCEEVRVIPMTRWKKLFRMGRNVLSSKPFQVAYYYRKILQQEVDELVAKHQPDVLYAHLIRTSAYLEKHLQTPRVVGMQIAQTLNYGRLIKHENNLIRRLFYTIEHLRVKPYEREVVQKFERLLLISPHDKQAICPTSAANKIFFSPHGIDVDYYSEELGLEREENVIAMNGDFGVPTNIDGALHFYRTIFPLIKAQIPDAKLWLIGRNPHASILRLAEKDSSVTVTGRVQDIRPYLQRAMVAIAPMRVAAGLQNKILVSLASSLPIVVTPISNEGICAPKGEVLIEADEVQDFAQSVINLLQNSEQRVLLGNNAIRFMQEYWTWDFHFEKLEQMLAQLIQHPAQAVHNYYPLPQHTKEQVLAEG